MSYSNRSKIIINTLQRRWDFNGGEMHIFQFSSNVKQKKFGSKLFEVPKMYLREKIV